MNMHCAQKRWHSHWFQYNHMANSFQKMQIETCQYQHSIAKYRKDLLKMQAFVPILIVSCH